MNLRDRRPLLAVLVGIGLALGGCTGEVETPGEALRIFGNSLPAAFINEPYSESIIAVGGLRPYTFTIEDGSLPPGLALQGGSIRGTPTATGSFEFSVVVSDANLSRTFQRYTIQVTEPPPAELILNVPLTEVQGTVRLRGQIENARSLRAFRTLLRWDAQRYELVEGSLVSNAGALAMLSNTSPGELQIDGAVLGGNLDGTHSVFSFELRALEPTFLLLEGEVEFLSGTTGHAFATIREGRAPPPAPAQDPGENLPGDNPEDQNPEGDGGSQGASLGEKGRSA